MGEEGESCPFCSAPIGLEAESTRCPSCGAAYHRDCWKENEGCAMVGCSSGEVRVTGRLPKIKKSGDRRERASVTPSRTLPGVTGSSIYSWALLFLAGVIAVVAVTLLVFAGDDEGSDPTPIPLQSGPSENPAQKTEPPAASARVILTREGYRRCGSRAFRKDNTSDSLCLAVAREVRKVNRPSVVVGAFSNPDEGGTGYQYDLECRRGNVEKVLQSYRFCTEVSTTDPAGVSAGGVAEVVVGP